MLLNDFEVFLPYLVINHDTIKIMIEEHSIKPEFGELPYFLRNDVFKLYMFDDEIINGVSNSLTINFTFKLHKEKIYYIMKYLG
jgi:hypothetical protein